MSEFEIKWLITRQREIIEQQQSRIKELEAEIKELKHPWTNTSVTLEVHQDNVITFEEGEG